MIGNILSTPVHVSKVLLPNKQDILDHVQTLVGDNDSYNGYYVENQLHKTPLYHTVCSAAVENIKDYLNGLGHQTRDGSNWGLGFSRMWATQFNREKAIQVHQHSGQGGVISGVLYLKLPSDVTSGIQFHPAHPPFLERIPFNTNFTDVLEVEEDLLVLFPSETLHSGLPNESTQQRINIAFDVVYFDNLYGPRLV